MELKRQILSTVEVKFIKLVLPVCYDDEDIAHVAPLRVGNTWTATIDLETGIIEGWKQGQALQFDIKVVDGGSYYLLSPDHEIVASLEQEYVPDFVPGDYVDCIELTIDETGKILNWKVPHQDDFSAFYDRGKFI